MRLLTDKLSQKVDEQKTTNERMTALIDLGLQLGSERDPQKLLQSFCHAAREVVGASIAMVVLKGEAEGLGDWYTSGMDPALVARLLPGDPWQEVLGTVLKEQRCVRWAPGTPPSREEGRRRKEETEGFDSSFLLLLSSFLGAPIVSRERTYGCLCLLDKRGSEEFSAEDERLAAVLAAQVGRTYENDILYAGVVRHAEELEEEVARRRRAEQALRESEELFRGAFENTNVATVLTDTEHRIVRVNAAFAQLFGYSEQEMLRLSMPDITHPEDLSKSYALREGLLAGRSPFFQMEKRYLHKAGHVLWALTNVSLVRDSSGQPHFYVVQVQDITERKRAEEALRLTEQRLQHVIASSPDVLYTLAIEGEEFRPTWISDNVQEMMGYLPAEVFKPGWWKERVHPEDLQRTLAELRDLLTQGRLATEYRFRHQGGKYRWVRSEMRLLHDARKAPVEVVGSWSDITERKHLEDQFRQSQKMEAIGRLAGGVAHDFNNLLTVINGYGELLLGRLPAGNPNRDLVREMVAAGSRAAALTRQLLVFSRKALLELKILDLKVVVADVDKLLRRIIGEDIQLAVVTAPEPGTVKADASHMEQVILNLVVNARDAMPQGGRLTIEVKSAELDETYARDHPDARPGPYVLLAVTDTGCGMNAATLARIWEPFFTTKGDKGTGLGLATVYGIVKHSGGHVAVYSEVGHGTTFKVYLPRAEQRLTAGKSHHGPAVMARGSERVLLVEDEDGVRALARHVLAGCGYSVLEARDGPEAVQLAGQHAGPIDLLVTDVVMPRIGGRQVAERVAALHPGVKVLFLSGYTDDAVVRHGILEAQVAFLQKPFSPAALAAKVREVLDARP